MLAPTLFLFYINNHAKKLPEEAVNPISTEDISILLTARNKVDAEHLSQTEVDIAFQWS